MISNYDRDYIDSLNKVYRGGKFIKAIVLTENPVGPVRRYWADHEEAISFAGNTYEPLHMRWDNIKTSASMPIEGASISVSNLTGAVRRYIREIDITGNEVIIQLLHLDLLATLTTYWQRKGKVLAGPSADVLTGTFIVGRQLGRNRLPRKVFLRSDFPGLTSDIPRIF